MPRFTAPSEAYFTWPERSSFENRPSFLQDGEYTDLALDDSIRCDLN